MCDEECDFETFMSTMDEIDKVNTDTLSTNNNVKDIMNKSNEGDRNDVCKDGDDEDDDLLIVAAKEVESNSQISETVSKSDSSSVASSIQTQMLEEMRKMQEKIMMLESQLKTQKESTVKPKAQPKPKLQPINQLTNNSINQKSFEAKTISEASQDSNSQPISKLSFAEAIQAATNPEINKVSDNLHRLTKNENSELFGDFEDGDDWEGLDGERVSELSESGKELIRTLNNEKRRIAHLPRHHESSQIRPATTTAKPKASLEKAPSNYITSLIGIPNHPGITSSYTGDHCSVLRTSSIDEGSVIKEQYSGIRIANPLVSNDQMKMLMDNRKMIKMSSLRQKLGSHDLDGDWVTMGVLVSKSEQKTSAKGQQYCIWKLSDLTDCDKQPVSVFLFRDVNTTHYKTMIGSVLGFLNPSVMSNKEDYKSKSTDNLSLTVDNAKKILPLGISKDFGTCKGRTKVGSACTNYINMSQGDHCSYHVQAAYKKQSAKRAELQNGFSGVVPKFRKDLEKIRNNGSSIVSYNNDVFTSKSTSKSTTKVSLQSLLNHQSQVKEMSLQGNNESLKKRNEVNTLLLHDLLTPTEKVKASESQGQSSKDGKDKIFHELLMKPSVGSMNFVKYLKDVNGVPSVSPTSKKLQKEPEVTAELLFKDMKKVKSDSSPVGPKLGRGMDKDGFINLDSPPPSIRSAKQALANERAKLAAIQKIKEMGGLKRKDPNSTSTDRHDKDYQERIKKRLREAEECNSPSSSTPPPAKKSKLLGSIIDINSPEMQKLINAKSAHENLLSTEQEAKQDQYFNALEKVETMEEKMISLKEIKVTAVHCPTCKYTALSGSSLCVAQGHKTKKVKATKRFFKCKDCNYRTYSLDRIPSIPCKCGGQCYEQTGMMSERKGPLLDSEKLLLRGEERKYVSSF